LEPLSLKEDPEMSVRVIIESDIKIELLDKLLLFLEKNLSNVRGFSGCLNVTVLLNKESGKMMFDEKWLTAGHHKKYISFITDNGVMNELGYFLNSPPRIHYLDCLDI
jgi:quinol monooxygenase YgiN